MRDQDGEPLLYQVVSGVIRAWAAAGAAAGDQPMELTATDHQYP